MGMFSFHYFRKLKQERDVSDFKKYILDIVQDAKKETNFNYAQLSNEIIEIRSGFTAIEKLADESKKLLNQMSITQAFVPRAKRNDEVKKSN
jgi:hypothetical protein